MNKQGSRPCVLVRAGTYTCSDQGKDQICVLLSIINTLAHNICTEMEWTTADYQMTRPFDLSSTCEEECRSSLTSHCNCCLLRIYIRTIILNEFPTIIKEGSIVEDVISFVDLCFNELLLSENLYKTIETHLSGCGDKNLVDNLTNVFAEIKIRTNSITFDKFYIQGGLYFDNSNSISSSSRNLEILLKERNLYAIFDDHSPQFLDFLEINSNNIPTLNSSLFDPSQSIQSILCGDDQGAIDAFMSEYLSKNMKNSQTPMSAIFFSLEREAAAVNMSILNNTFGHAMVLKCIFSYDGKKWVYYKNSWGTNIGFSGEHIAPLGVFSDCRIYLPRFLQLNQNKISKKKQK